MVRERILARGCVLDLWLYLTKEMDRDLIWL
jgi:hypothetical protein